MCQDSKVIVMSNHVWLIAHELPLTFPSSQWNSGFGRESPMLGGTPQPAYGLWVMVKSLENWDIERGLTCGLGLSFHPVSGIWPALYTACAPV